MKIRIVMPIGMCMHMLNYKIPKTCWHMLCQPIMGYQFKYWISRIIMPMNMCGHKLKHIMPKKILAKAMLTHFGYQHMTKAIIYLMPDSTKACQLAQVDVKTWHRIMMCQKKSEFPYTMAIHARNIHMFVNVKTQHHNLSILYVCFNFASVILLFKLLILWS